MGRSSKNTREIRSGLSHSFGGGVGGGEWEGKQEGREPREPQKMSLPWGPEMPDATSVHNAQPSASWARAPGPLP